MKDQGITVTGTEPTGDLPSVPPFDIPAVPFDITSIEAANRLPVGTIIAAHERTTTDDSVWIVVAPKTARLLSHHTTETESLDWFLRDGGHITVWSYPLPGRTAPERPADTGASVGQIMVRLDVERVDEPGDWEGSEPPYSYLTFASATVIDSTLSIDNLAWLAQDVSELDPDAVVEEAIRQHAGPHLVNFLVEDAPTRPARSLFGEEMNRG